MRIFKRLKIAYGAAIFFAITLFNGSYRGAQLVHIKAQRDEGINDRALKALLESPLASPFIQRDSFLQLRDADSLTLAAKKQYSDPDLSGYADWEYKLGGGSLSEQQRGQILEPLLDAVRRMPPDATLSEIGTGNGDVVAFIAKEFPTLQVIGVDFITQVAEKKYSSQSNAQWVSGYALNLIEGGHLNADLFWVSSTFCLMPPLELRRYINAIRDSGTSTVVVNEPSWGQLPLHNTGVAGSTHLEGIVWHHNYPALFGELGFNTVYQTFNAYRHPLSPRPEIRLAIGVYEVR